MVTRTVLAAFALAGAAGLTLGCSSPDAPTTERSSAPVFQGTDWTKLVAACPDPGQKPVIQQVATGDVTGDRAPDAVVARTCEATTSYWPSTVEIFDGAAGKKRLGTLLSDVGPTDDPWVTAVSISDGEITIKANGVSPGGANACPDLSLTYHYALNGTTFERLTRDATKSTDCLPAG